MKFLAALATVAAASLSVSGQAAGQTVTLNFSGTLDRDYSFAGFGSTPDPFIFAPTVTGTLTYDPSATAREDPFIYTRYSAITGFTFDDGLRNAVFKPQNSNQLIYVKNGDSFGGFGDSDYIEFSAYDDFVQSADSVYRLVAMDLNVFDETGLALPSSSLPSTLSDSQFHDRLFFVQYTNLQTGQTIREGYRISFGSAVPEPVTWSMMLLGFGMVGGAARYRRRSVKVSLA